MGPPLGALEIYSNRGTSGIDGTISTAIGAARIKEHKTVTLICGDLSLFYDQNAFWQNNLPSNLKIVILNNQSGNIFNWIEGPKNHPETLSYFTTPHALSVKKLTDQFGLNYLNCDAFSEITDAIDWLYSNQEGVSILELSFKEEENLRGINEFKQIALG
jgi:2-succinyl-5-enolpyruvyl-6-hydroxy-3-cyclohexene-1-carboxylate synthase